MFYGNGHTLPAALVSPLSPANAHHSVNEVSGISNGRK